MDRGVLELNATGVVSLSEANRRIGIILHFTRPLAAKVEQVINQLEALGASNRERTAELEAEVEGLIQTWNQKVQKLGGVPKGLWLVDLDAGDGYFCWKYPDPEIKHWHEYKSGFPGRITLEERDKIRRLKPVRDPSEDLIDRL